MKERRSLLSGRPYFEKSTKQWYELWNQRRLERFQRCKIGTLDNASRNSFCLDEDGYVGTTTVYSLILKNREPSFIRFVLGILNSSTAEYFHKRNTIPQAGGFYRYQASFIENIPICDANEGQRARIATLVDQMLTTKSCDVEADTNALERQVDCMVYKLYGLSREEIAAVESGE